ncbi:claudin-8-like [Sardina pilchardus]|uniref:claudin-8-like n=1 Tax=Sardina pilchardus TaxID=27697 RepID=UPI002E0F456A
MVISLERILIYLSRGQEGREERRERNRERERKKRDIQSEVPSGATTERMVQGPCELIAMCLGVVGLFGAAAVTGMPMWKVTAFIGENIIVMETRWEGLWMNCYRQANIRMQCKVYDSLLFLPPDLQAARGLMCCAVALSGVGLLLALAGLQCLSCLREQPRVKSILLMVAGAMQIMASACVFIPVSWTGNTIIRNFYNPLLVDAQRHELGEALYVGWVDGAVLFASGLAFLCRWQAFAEQGSFEVYHPGAKPTLTRFHPLSSTVSSVGNHPLMMHQTSFLHPNPSVHSMAVAPQGGYPQPTQYHPQFMPPVAPLVYNGNVMASHPSSYASQVVGGHVTPMESLYHSQHSTPYTASHGTTPYASYNSASSYHPVPQNPVFVGYNHSRVQAASSTTSSGMRI